MSGEVKFVQPSAIGGCLSYLDVLEMVVGVANYM